MTSHPKNKESMGVIGFLHIFFLSIFESRHDNEVLDKDAFEKASKAYLDQIKLAGESGSADWKIIEKSCFMIIADHISGLNTYVKPPPCNTNSDYSSLNDVDANKYAKIKTGMSYGQVVSIIGRPGIEDSSSEFAGIRTAGYSWRNSDGGSAMLIFQNGRLTLKAQTGLK
jgi:hypothetical protein